MILILTQLLILYLCIFKFFYLYVALDEKLVKNMSRVGLKGGRPLL